jgi:hypothetical protein
MKHLRLFLFAAAAAAQVTVNGPINSPFDGELFTGTITVTGPALRNGGSYYAQTVKKYTVTGGVFSQTLIPNTGSTPSGTSYAVEYLAASGLRTRAYWVVPATGPTTVAAIETAIAPTPSWSVAWSQITGAPSFLSDPTTTRGDLIRRGASALERLALGSNGHVLTSNGTDAVWAAPSGGGSGVPDPGSNGLVVRTGSGATAARTLTAGSSQLTVTNGDGVSGNPTVNIGTLTANTSGNAGTATALAANGANCTSGQYPKGVDASGAAEGCAVIPAADVPSLDAAKVTTGTFAIARLASGTPDGTKFVRDDGTLAVPSGGGGKPPQYCYVSNGVVYGSSPASGWTIPTQANMPQPVVATSGAGSTATESTLQFTANNTFVEMQCPISPDYNAAGTASIWMSLTSVQTATNITFSVQQCVVDTGEASSCTYGGSQTITVTPQGTTLRRNVGVLANLTKTNWAANETLKIKLTLTASTGNVNLHWFRLAVPQI